MARDVVFLDGLGDYLFRGAIRINVGSIPLLLSVHGLVVPGPFDRDILCSRLYRRLL